MAGCGYVCPLCEGTGYGSDALPCEYCCKESDKEAKENELKEWIEKVHEGPCCSDQVDEN